MLNEKDFSINFDPNLAKVFFVKFEFSSVSIKV